MQIKRGNDIHIVWSLLWDDKRIIPLNDAVNLIVKVVNQNTLATVKHTMLIQDNQVQISILADDIKHFGKYRLEISWQFSDSTSSNGFSSYSADCHDAFEITPFGVAYTLGQKFEINKTSVLYFGYKSNNVGGEGITPEQADWIGEDIELINGAESLPEGVNKNTVDLQALCDGVNDNSRAIVAINEVLAARFPFRILSFSGGKIAEKGTAVSVALTWSYDGIPTSQKLAQNGSDVPVLLTDRSKSVTGINANTTFILTANGLTASQSISFYNCRYVGVVSEAPATEEAVKALTKLAVASNKNYTWTGNLDNNSVCYAYPKAFGALTSIKDANNFDYLSGYSRSEVTVNGEAYYVYMSSKSIINDFKQIFG